MKIPSFDTVESAILIGAIVGVAYIAWKATKLGTSATEAITHSVSTVIDAVTSAVSPSASDINATGVTPGWGAASRVPGVGGPTLNGAAVPVDQRTTLRNAILADAQSTGDYSALNQFDNAYVDNSSNNAETARLDRQNAPALLADPPPYFDPMTGIQLVGTSGPSYIANNVNFSSPDAMGMMA